MIIMLIFLDNVKIDGQQDYSTFLSFKDFWLANARQSSELDSDTFDGVGDAGVMDLPRDPLARDFDSNIIIGLLAIARR